MEKNQSVKNSFVGKKTYPLGVSIAMIAVAIVLSFVDLAFLNDVIGKVLDIGSTESMLVAFALGMVGIVIMAHKGLKDVNGREKARHALAHYLLWVLLGLAFVMIRFFSATIMQLDNSYGDEALIKIIGLNVREVDLVIAPVMFLLYLATGVVVKDGTYNLLLNPEFEIRLAKWRENRSNRKSKEERLRAKAEERQRKAREEAEERQRKAREKAEADRLKQEEIKESDRIKNALNGSYSNAQNQYREKEKEIKLKYQTISANLDYIKDIDRQEKDFELNVKPRLLKIVKSSNRSTQNSVALNIRKKTGEDIINLRNVIELHNNHPNVDQHNHAIRRNRVVQ